MLRGEPCKALALLGWSASQGRYKNSRNPPQTKEGGASGVRGVNCLSVSACRCIRPDPPLARNQLFPGGTDRHALPQ
jgi:hypothetical protein